MPPLHRGRLKGPGSSPRLAETSARCPLRDRLTVLRADLIALLDRHGGRCPRIVGGRWRNDGADLLELLVETDITTNDWHVLEAIHDVQRLLGATVQFHDVTALRLVAPDRLERLEREAVPL